ncbi:MAG: serine hydrolase [Caldithrix sp.]|nr:serine hydrolase [Caldithrix sp.]
MRLFKTVCLLSLMISITLFGQPFPQVEPSQVGLNSDKLVQTDTVIQKAIQQGDIPGAVLLVLRHGKSAYYKAYGHRQIVPEKEVMTKNTIFDVASITKPVATATSAMMLLEQGKLRLLDLVSHYFPHFKAWKGEDGRRRSIRIIHLLTHTSGLPPYAPVEELKTRFGTSQPDSLFDYIAKVDRQHAPGKRFIYSCLNFITLQRIIEKISGESLSALSEKYIFDPLSMQDTYFLPDDSVIDQCAPTEIYKDEGLLRGKVHDPLARLMMECNSGNAGLFSTAGDMAIFAQMMLNNGQLNGKRILSAASVKAMTELPIGYEKFGRGLGWDLNSAYASNQGDLLSEATYGHTGYTGTSIVIDPINDLAIILMTNRVHPEDTGNVVRLRSLVANVVASAIE